MRYPYRATIYRRAAAATVSARGKKSLTLEPVATDYPLDVQRKDGGVVLTEAGPVRQGTWRGYLQSGFAVQPDDRIRITRSLRDGGAGVPTKYRVVDVYPIGGRWATEAELEISGETFPEEA
jgi:hypothetical protein